MDGTLVNTEPYWIRSETELLARYGVTWRHEDALQMVGKGLWHSAEILRAAGASELSADEIVYSLSDSVRGLLRTQGIPWQPGARELLRELREAGIHTALVTMSLRDMAEEVAGQAGFDAFDVIVAGDDGTEAKPHPGPYLRALQLLGVDAGHSVGIEDSLTGVASARAAGLATLGVPHMIDLSASVAHVVWPSLAGRTLADLESILNEAAR